MAWRCSYGVENCPICRRPQEDENQTRLRKEKLLKQVQSGLLAGRIKPVLKNGRMTLQGITEEEQIAGDGDEQILRAIMVGGSALAKAAIAKAEQLAGRTRRVIER